MNDKTLYLAWQDQAKTRNWFPVGRLDVLPEESGYRFRYIRGAEQAAEETMFGPMLDFPDFHRAYESRELFPLFQNRLLPSGRKDFPDYLRQLDLVEGAEPFEILSVAGGYRATDSFEVFPRIERRADGAFRCRFFLHGWRHVNEDSQRQLQRLQGGDPLGVTLELTNPATKLAVQIHTPDYHMIGWAPRYLVRDLAAAIVGSPWDYEAKVVRINPVPAPSKQRVLIELRGHWPKHEPMTGDEFEPLVK